MFADGSFGGVVIPQPRINDLFHNLLVLKYGINNVFLTKASNVINHYRDYKGSHLHTKTSNLTTAEEYYNPINENSI